MVKITFIDIDKAFKSVLQKAQTLDKDGNKVYENFHLLNYQLVAEELKISTKELEQVIYELEDHNERNKVFGMKDYLEEKRNYALVFYNGANLSNEIKTQLLISLGVGKSDKGKRITIIKKTYTPEQVKDIADKQQVIAELQIANDKLKRYEDKYGDINKEE